MKNTSFYRMFVEMLREAYDAENQIVKALPLMIQTASHKELKEALSKHLIGTKEQVTRLKTIFSILGENSSGFTCRAVKGIMEDAQEALDKQTNSAVKDACLIACCQKVEHYEIALYGSASTFADHLENVYEDIVDFDEICHLLEKSLDEESKADKKLTILAEGRFFDQGINDEAEKELRVSRTR